MHHEFGTANPIFISTCLCNTCKVYLNLRCFKCLSPRYHHNLVNKYESFLTITFKLSYFLLPEQKEVLLFFYSRIFSALEETCQLKIQRSSSHFVFHCEFSDDYCQSKSHYLKIRSSIKEMTGNRNGPALICLIILPDLCT